MSDTNQQPSQGQSPWDSVPGAGTWQDIRRRASAAATGRDDLRIGDSERNEMAELLSKHFSDGRLTEAEFRERMDAAMAAKTRADLRGLLSDLPSLGLPQTAAPVSPRRRRVGRTVVFVFAFFAVLSTIGWWSAPWHFQNHVGPWFLLGVTFFFLLCLRGFWHRSGSYHHHHHHES